MRHGILMIAVTLLAGCAFWGNQERQDSFERVSRAYEKAMEWSNFDALPGIVRLPEGDAPFNPSAFKDYKVTSYKTRGGVGSAKSGVVQRTALISYVWLPRMSERTVTVTEIWEYSEKDKRWFLKSGLPQFR